MYYNHRSRKTETNSNLSILDRYANSLSLFCKDKNWSTSVGGQYILLAPIACYQMYKGVGHLKATCLSPMKYNTDIIHQDIIDKARKTNQTVYT